MAMLIGKPRISIPKTVTKDQIFPVKVMVKHPMENGRRKDKVTNEVVPRMIINKFVCSYNERQAFVADLHPSVSANPYISFFLKAKDSGEIKFTWTDDLGESATESRKITVQ